MAKYNQITKQKITQTSSGWPDYELIDSGNKKKLERFGQNKLVRFEPDAFWKPSLSPREWAQADAEYVINPGKNTGFWRNKPGTPEKWNIQVDEITITLKISDSRHIGIFPEQIMNWRWMANKIKNTGKKIKVLNLFAYSGVASLYCANSGAHVTHVDASHGAIEMAKISAHLSNLDKKPIRWIHDDVMKFMRREIRRGKKYDAIIMDPPKFGRGPKGELWKFEDSINGLLLLSKQLMSDDPLFFLLTAYNVNLDGLKLADIFINNTNTESGNIEYGPLIQVEKSARRKIYQSIYMRWSNL